MKLYSIVYYTVVLLAMAACTSKTPEKQTTTPGVTVVEAYKKVLPTQMRFVGQTYSSSDVLMQPRVSGYLLSTHFDSGMPVKKGQLLFKLDSDQMSVEVAKAKALLASEQSQLVDATSNYKRSIPLSRIKAISRSTLDQATASLASAKANVLSAKASLRSAELNLSYASIYAPMSGIIGKTNGSVGDYVGVGTNYPVLATISDIDSISVHISIPMVRYHSIVEQNSGHHERPIYDNEDLLSEINMFFASGELYPYKGEYGYTEHAVNTTTGALVVHVTFPNPDKHLIPGQYVQVKANVGTGIGAVLVPQRAVIQSQTSNSVFVVGKDSLVQYRAVKLGNTHGGEWEILEGVESGELVLTEGLQKVHKGMKIAPVVKSEI